MSIFVLIFEISDGFYCQYLRLILRDEGKRMIYDLLIQQVVLVKLSISEVRISDKYISQNEKDEALLNINYIPWK